MTILSDTIRFIRDNLRQFKERRGLQYLLIFAFILRLGYLVLMLRQLSVIEIMNLAPDTVRYVGLGKELLNWRIMDEAAVLLFGPGYGAFLGVVFFLFGVNPIGVLLIQIILSSLGCLLIYRLGRELTRSKAVGYIAGLLMAASFTSISLANFILSDTLFFFLFLWGNLAFLLGLKNQKRSYFIFSGFCIGLAILTRSIGQFWPLIMIGLVFILPLDRFARWSFKNRLRLLRTAGLAPLLAIALMSVWMVRNYHHHSLPMLAFTSAGGPANIAALALSKVQGEDANDIMVEKIEIYLEQKGQEELSWPDRYRLYSSIARQTFIEHPAEMISIFLGLVWTNLNKTNTLYSPQLPKSVETITLWIQCYRDWKLNFTAFWLSLAGLMLMASTRKWTALFLLSIIYLYFALLIGFTQWQGSRLFYPGQIASSILTAYLITAAGRIFIRRT